MLMKCTVDWVEKEISNCLEDNMTDTAQTHADTLAALACGSSCGTKWLMCTEPVACTTSVVDHMTVILRSPQSVCRPLMVVDNGPEMSHKPGG